MFSIAPEAFVPYRDVSVTVRQVAIGSGKSKRDYLELSFDLDFKQRKKSFRLEIYPETFSSKIGKFFGMQDIVVGHPFFDDLFIVKCSDVSIIRNGFGDQQSYACIELNNLFGGKEFNIHLDGYRARIRKRHRPNTRQEISVFFRSSFPILDFILNQVSDKNLVSANEIFFIDQTNIQGSLSNQVQTSIQEDDDDLQIEFIQPEKKELSACPVCGEQVFSNIVTCRDCHTPHHLDCWEYSEQCTTFGCQSTLYRKH